MDRLDLPKHIVEKVERRWAQKLQEEVTALKGSRSESQGVTATGVPVVRRGKKQSSLKVARRSRITHAKSK